MANQHILSADVTARQATVVRTIARSNGTSVSAILRAALDEWLRRRGVGGSR